MLTYADDQMKGTTNHTTIKSTSCLCEKESLQTALKKVMAMIPSNSDFGRMGFSNVTQTQITMAHTEYMDMELQEGNKQVQC